MSKFPKVSIIIPVIKINDYIIESMEYILALNYSNFEVLIFPDEKDTVHSWKKTRLIASGKVGPAEKRDLALKYAKGEIFAFLDDDAYPKPNWLKQMVPLFQESQVGAVGGPAVTPNSDNVLQKVSGAIFETYLGGAFARNRYLPIGKKRSCTDWPTVNLFVHRDVFLEIGGFNSKYWPGEDTKLCLDIVNAGHKIIYNPSGVVYHHRRSDLFAHFKQVGNYALHRGFFAKIYPKTSLKIGYFVPTLFVLYLIIWILILFRYSIFDIRIFASAPLLIYCLLLIADSTIISLRWRNPLIGVLTIPMVFLTHLWYGARFLYGLIIPRLTR